ADRSRLILGECLHAEASHQDDRDQDERSGELPAVIVEPPAGRPWANRTRRHRCRSSSRHDAGPAAGAPSSRSTSLLTMRARKPVTAAARIRASPRPIHVVGTPPRKPPVTDVLRYQKMPSRPAAIATANGTYQIQCTSSRSWPRK